MTSSGPFDASWTIAADCNNRSFENYYNLILNLKSMKIIFTNCFYNEEKSGSF